MRKDIVGGSINIANRKEVFRAGNKRILIFMVLMVVIFLSGCVEVNNNKLTIIGSTAGAQTNYPVKLSVYNSSGTDTPGVVYFGGKVRSDFGDLRFTKSDRITPLDYWIESYTSGVSAVVWVNVDSIQAYPSKTDIYLHYGNSSATSASNGKATFTFFDDFNDLNNWVTDISPNYNERLSSSVSNGEVTITTSVSNSYPSGSYAIKRTPLSFNPNVAIRTRFRDASSYYPCGFGFGTYSGTPPNLTGDYTVQKGIYTAGEFMGMSAKNGTRTYSSAYPSDSAYYIWDLIWTPNKTELQRNGVSLWSNTDTSTIPTMPLNLGIGNMGEYGGGWSSSGMTADWILVRNCVNPEPTWA